MESSRIGVSLKSARARLGWSRETLAHHSGVSWSAIAQIESGRRKDVRLSSLSALAHALGVSVDYLIEPSASMAPPLLEHRLLTYGSDEEFLAGAIPFIAEGLERSESLLAVVTEPKLGLLREILGNRPDRVELADWADWYRSPNEALGRYGEFVTQKFEAGAAWVRVVAEAAWAGETDAEIATWTRYESLVNLAFASSPVTFTCTYDERSFPADVVDDARRTHPQLTQGSDGTANPAYREPADFLLDPLNATP
jgi:transcriptional regulator with XRE-family HTH domain